MSRGEKSMQKHTLLLFDLDETLLEGGWFKEGIIKTLQSHPLTRDIDAELFLEKKLRIPKPLVTQFKNRELLLHQFRRARWEHVFSCFNLDPDMPTIDEINELFLTTGMGCIKEDEKLTLLLTELQNHYRLGIVTNALYDPIMKIFHMKLSDIFKKETTFQAEELGFRKPEPEIYKAALVHFDISAEKTIFIGDSWVHDVAGAIDIGMDAIWVNFRNGQPTTDHKPLAVISEITELRAVLLSK
jgi:5'-nucleotidase